MIRQISLERLLDIALLTLGGCLALTYASVLGSVVYPFTDDGVIYVESARNLLLGRGLVHTPYSVFPSDAELVPLQFFPPGYPLLIAAAASLGLDVQAASLTVTRLSVALVPFLVNWAVRPVAPLDIRVGTAVLVATSPAVMETSFAAMTDVPFLGFSLLSVGCLLRARDGKAGTAYLLVSGVAAGLCYSVRIFGAAFLLAGAATVLAKWTFRTDRLRFYQGFTWGASAAAVVLPLWYRNLSMFGTVQPYGIPPLSPSISDFVLEFREHLWNLLVDVSGATAAGIIAWDWKLAAALGGVASWIIIRMLVRARDAGVNERQRVFLIFAGLYLVVGTGVVVYGQANYGAGDYLRYAIPHSWMLVLGLLYAAARAWATSIRLRLMCVVAACLALLAFRLMYIDEFVYREKLLKHAFESEPTLAKALEAYGGPPDSHVRRQLIRFHATNPEVPRLLRSIPAGSFVASNYGHLLNFATPYPTRRLEGNLAGGNAWLAELAEVCRAVRDREVAALILPDQLLLRRFGDQWQPYVLGKLPNGGVVGRSANALLVSPCQRTQKSPE